MPEIYFPVRKDFRGRIYTVPHYFNYQGSDLAKALLLFAYPGVINRNDSEAIEYLKAYGANCFGNKLDKKSWVERVKWVDDNTDKIRNFYDGELISKAESKSVTGPTSVLDSIVSDTFWNTLLFRSVLLISLKQKSTPSNSKQV